MDIPDSLLHNESRVDVISFLDIGIVRKYPPPPPPPPKTKKKKKQFNGIFE